MIVHELASDDIAPAAAMPHVFQSSVGRLAAAERSLDAIGIFLRGCLSGDKHVATD